MIDTCVTPKNKPFKPSHTFVYTMATMLAECVFCFSNFKIRGTFHSSVLLFTSSDNKDIVRLTNGVHADKVTLCVLLSHIGIKGYWQQKILLLYLKEHEKISRLPV